MNIYQRLQKIQETVAYVRKDQKIDNKYWAVTHDQVTSMVREHFVKNGVIVVPRLVASTFTDSGRKTSGGTAIMRYEATYEVSFVNVDEPTDVVVVPCSAHGEDTGDKAPGKALSYAVKMVILKVLMIETGESDESRVKGDEESSAKTLSASDVALILTTIAAAKTVDDVRRLTTAGRATAEQANDAPSFKKITEAGTKRAAELAPKAETVDKETGEITPKANGVEKPAQPALLKVLRGKAAAIGVTEEQMLKTHHLTALEGISTLDANTIIKSLAQGKSYYTDGA